MRGMAYILAEGGEWIPIVIVIGAVLFRVFKAMAGGGADKSKSTNAPKQQVPAQNLEEMARRRREQLQELARRRQQAMQQKQQQRGGATHRPPPMPMSGGSAEQMRRQRLEQLRRHTQPQSQPQRPSQVEAEARAAVQAAALARAEQDRLAEIARRQDIARREAELERQRKLASRRWEADEQRRMAVVAGMPGVDNDEHVHRHVTDAKPDAKIQGMSHSDWIQRLGKMNRSTLQRAIILKEVLDTPIGLRE